MITEFRLNRPSPSIRISREVKIPTLVHISLNSLSIWGASVSSNDTEYLWEFAYDMKHYSEAYRLLRAVGLNDNAEFRTRG